MDLPQLWALTGGDLMRARSTLPGSAANHEAIQQYEEFLGHNELELACDMLEEYARDQPVSREVWLALRDAAARMELEERADR